LAIGATVAENVKPKSSEQFLISWPARFEGEVADWSVFANTNWLSLLNFLEEYRD